MTISGNQKTRRIKKTNEQKDAGKKLETFLKDNKIKDGDEISLAMYRLLCLDFIGGDGLSRKTVYDKLPVAFDKYIERGFKLTGQEKNFLLKNKETIISLIKPFYWEDNGKLAGMNFQIRLPDYVDGFGGVFNLDTDDFVM
ncbi:MAG: hypothetical protein LBH44_04775 [Treponema sp.]|nr:hypothetical protein [Treponema sp.]